MDIGTGDGTYPYRKARIHPSRLFIGIDSNASNMALSSRKARRKPARGGVKNLLYVHATVEKLPEELSGLAEQLTIFLPWGSLLKALVTPEPLVLKELRKLCRVNAGLKIILGYNHSCEPGFTAKTGLPELSRESFNSLILPAYQRAGFRLQIRDFKKPELTEIPSRWAQKLARGKDRNFFELKGKAQ
ncbi:class I SAM-dependent methyltransferase [Candidatus Riflebacteria bacterium]